MPLSNQVPLFEGTEIGFLKMLSMKVKPVYFLSKEYVVRKGDIGQEVTGSGLINTPHYNGFNDNTYGYWPSAKSRRLDTGQVPFCVFMDRHEVEVHVDRTSLANKGSIKRTFSCGTNGRNTKRARLADLPARVANQNTGFASFCPLADSAIW